MVYPFMIFTATTGRSGTGYLANLFGRAKNCRASHEETFPVQGEPMRSLFLRNDIRPVHDVFNQGLAFLKSLPNKPTFFLDSSHLFIRSYCESAHAAFGENMLVLDLRRPFLDVARSLLNRGTLIGTRDGDAYLYRPEHRGNCLKLPEQVLGHLSDLQRLHLYCLECHARTELYLDMNAIAAEQVIRVPFSAIGNADRMRALAEKIGIEPDDDFDARAERTVNANQAATVTEPGDTEQFLELVRLLKQHGNRVDHLFDWEGEI